MWKRATFKGKEVWAEVDDAGRPVVEGGRRRIRYSDKAGATLYRAGASGVADGPTAAVELPEGAAADDRPAAATTARPAGRGSGFGSAGTRTQAQAQAAATDARARIAALPAGTILAFTDGACTGNPGPAGSGAVVRFPDGRAVERWKALGHGTNNQGELTAIALALDVLDEDAVPADAAVAVFTDSSYARGVLQLGWKAQANRELIDGIRARLRARPGAELHWVAGHVGVADNERADALARKGVEASRRR